MALSKTDYEPWHTLEGTIAEVAAALETYNVLINQIVCFESDLTDALCVYRKSEAT